MNARSGVQPAEPLRLFAVATEDGVVLNSHAGALAFTEHGLAQRAAGDEHRVVEFIEVRQPAERDTEWGDGQHDHVQLGPGVRAALRITPDGRVKLTIPGGELDVTDGGNTLGLGLCEAGARAAQIRVARLESARRRGAKPLCKRCGQSLFGYDPAQLPLCPASAKPLSDEALIAGQLCEAAADAPPKRRKLGAESARVAHLPRRSSR